MTIVNLSQKFKSEADAALRDKLETLMTEYESLKKIQVQQERRAAELSAQAGISAAESSMTANKVNLQLIQILQFGALYDDMLERESNWMPPYRLTNGDIVIGSPATESDHRTAVHISHANLVKSAKESKVDVDDDMFSGGNES